MEHSTPKLSAPHADTILFLTTFARFYSPDKHNEYEARLAAKIIARHGAYDN